MEKSLLFHLCETDKNGCTGSISDVVDVTVELLFRQLHRTHHMVDDPLICLMADEPVYILESKSCL